VDHQVVKGKEEEAKKKVPLRKKEGTEKRDRPQRRGNEFRTWKNEESQRQKKKTESIHAMKEKGPSRK